MQSLKVPLLDSYSGFPPMGFPPSHARPRTFPFTTEIVTCYWNANRRNFHYWRKGTFKVFLIGLMNPENGTARSKTPHETT